MELNERPLTPRDASIEDVAKLAGVSTASVSRVLNNVGNVSPKMFKRVSLAMQQLNYRPNSYSRTLRSGKTNTIAIYRTLWGIKDDLYSETLIQELTRVLSIENYRVMLELLTPARDGLHELGKLDGPNREVDGICIVGHIEPEDLEKIASWDIPVSLINLKYDHPNFCSVCLADEIGSEDVVQYLIALGRRDIAFVYGNLHWPGTRRRHEGFLSANRKFGISVPPEFLIQVDLNEQNYTGGFRAVEQLLALPHRPSAIFFVNDWYAIGGIAALQKHNIAIPGDISIVGFDDSWMARQVIPKLTTVSLEPNRLCTAAIELLLKKIERRPIVTPQCEIRPQLIVRDSCALKNQ